RAYRLRIQHPDWAPQEVEANPGEEPVEIILERGQRISGRLIDEEQQPVPAARVTVSRKDELARHTTTNIEGRFSVGGLGDGTYNLMARHQGHTSLKEEVEASAGELGDLVLEGATTISGVVLGPDGAPWPGARITAYLSKQSRNELGLGWQRARTYSVVDGLFTLKLPVASGVWSVSGDYPGFLRKGDQQIDVNSGKVSEVTISLSWGASVTGRITSENGNSLAGVRVSVRRHKSRRRDGEYGNARSRPDGYFQITGLKAGKFRLTATAQGYARAQIPEVILLEDQPQRVSLTLETEQFLVGYVMGPFGEPLEGARVTVRNPTLGASSVKSNADGYFEVRSLGVGEYQVYVRLRDYVGWGSKEWIPLPRLLKIRLQPTYEITGEIVDAISLRPIRGVQITVRKKPPPGKRARGRRFRGKSDEEGWFRIAGFPEGEWNLSVGARGYLPESALGLATPLNQEVLLRLRPGGRITGRLVDRGGRNISGANIHAYLVPPKKSGKQKRQRNVARARTNKDGWFELLSLQEGVYNLRISHSNYIATQVKDLYAKPGRKGPHVRKQLERGAELRGQVINLQGLKVKKGYVFVEGGEPKLRRRVGINKKSGEFRVGGLPPGHYQVGYQLKSKAPVEARKSATLRPQQRMELKIFLESQ
ncbi:MAG: carboxypeptidase-like regulatory domain-containing protein, partial [Planctomycetota bacterium]